MHSAASEPVATTPPPGRDVVILRIGEIFLKGDNRRAFSAALLRNARRLLADLPGVSVQPAHLRLLVHTPAALREQCLHRLGRLFGLTSLSPATAVAPTIDALAAEAIAQARQFRSEATFKVETRRRDKRFPLNSQAISCEVGTRVHQALGLRVDLHRPDHTLHLELEEQRGFVYSRTEPGPGGLPVGVSASVAALLSGGIDSPVAAWSAMRRGCRVSAIYFHSFPYTGDKTREKVLDLARILARWQGRMAVYVVPFTEVQKQLRDHLKAELAVLGYRRMMMRTATLLAERDGCQGLVTGENLGQVASQTVENLGVIEAAAGLPVLRPLLTYDKLEIVARAQAIGTYDTSILPYDDCCSLFLPRHPATRARVDILDRAEDGLPLAELAGRLADAAERVVVG
jgi:thiamine biosynthesis protein ThiI